MRRPEAAEARVSAVGERGITVPHRLEMRSESMQVLAGHAEKGFLLELLFTGGESGWELR